MGEVTKTAVKDMAQKLSCGNAPNNVRDSADKEDDRKYKIELGNLKNQFEQNNHYKPNYEVNYKRKNSVNKSESKDMGDILRPDPAGTREKASYESSFNKTNLSNLKSMFEQKKQETTVKTFVPDFSRPVATVRKQSDKKVNSDVVRSFAGEREKPEYVPTVSLSAAKSIFSQTKPDEYKPKQTWNRPVKKNPPPVQKETEEEKEEPATKTTQPDIIKCDDKIDDRPKELTTSLKSAKAMFEQQQPAVTIKKSVPQATWEGKDTSNVLNQAKSKFESEPAEKNSSSSEEEKEDSIKITDGKPQNEESIETPPEVLEECSTKVEENEESHQEEEPSVEHKESISEDVQEEKTQKEEENNSSDSENQEIPVSEVPISERPSELEVQISERPSEVEVENSALPSELDVQNTERPSELEVCTSPEQQSDFGASPLQDVVEESQTENSTSKQELPVSVTQDKKKERISSYESEDVLSDASQSSSVDEVKNENDFDV